MTTHTPMRVRLVGHRDLGIVKARWLGCMLELGDGTRYGPSAIYEVRPAQEAGAIVRWQQANGQPMVWNLLGHIGERVQLIATLGTDAGRIPSLDISVPHGGIWGKEYVVDKLLDAGWTWKDPASAKGHDTRGLNKICGRTVTMVDGTTCKIETVYSDDVLLADGTWMRLDDATKRIAYIHAADPEDDDIPF